MRSFLLVGSVLLVLGCDRSEKAPAPAASAPASATATPAPAASSGPSAGTPAPSSSAPTAELAVPSAPGTLRLVFATDAGSPPSDAQVTTLKTWIEKGGAKTDAAPVTDAERAYARALADRTDTPPPLPVSWAGFETVVLLRIEPPPSGGSQKRSGGRTHLVIVRPPAREPAFSTIYTERAERISAAPVDAGRLGAWLQMHLTLRQKGAKP